MTLYHYLKQYKNIAWYPSAGKDALAMICLSWKNLSKLGIPKEDLPDCFIFTDYDTYTRYSNNTRFALDLDEYESEAEFNYEFAEYKTTAFNVQQFDHLKLPFYEDMVTGEYEYQYYGNVYVCDVLVEHPEYGRYIAKLVYVIAENTSFAMNYLLKKHINIKYAIHCRYGHGFGGGCSCGAYMFHILKDLGVKYFASDMDEHYNNDIADKYLSEEQKSYYPILSQRSDFGSTHKWFGYERVYLYIIEGYERNTTNEPLTQRFRLVYSE